MEGKWGQEGFVTTPKKPRAAEKPLSENGTEKRPAPIDEDVVGEINAAFTDEDPDDETQRDDDSR